MINESSISEHYLEMSLSELRSRQTQLEARRHADGRLSKGMRTYRRRLKRALEMKEAEQKAQQSRYMHSEARPVNSRLYTQQRYDVGYQRGRNEALRGLPSAEAWISNPDEREGYRDGYRSTQAQRRSTEPSWSDD
jgi:hypothetical protein